MARLLVLLLGAVAIAGVGIGVARAGDGPPTVRAVGALRIEPNRFLAVTLRFDPGTITVRSGERLRFVKAESPGFGFEEESHTLTIVREGELPQTAAAAFSCSVCNRIGARHFKNGFENPATNLRVNNGPPGLNRRGDSLLIQPDDPAISARVTAAPGRTLAFMCLIHPWMQGHIRVTG